MTASDISQRALDRVEVEAERRGPRVECHHADANALAAFEPAAFDLVPAQYASIPRTPDGRGVRNLVNAVAPGARRHSRVRTRGQGTGVATRDRPRRHFGVAAAPARLRRGEERRVFHVAVTRCVESVTVVTGNPASPFVAELEDEASLESRTFLGRPAEPPVQSLTGQRPRPLSPELGPRLERLTAGTGRPARSAPLTETVPATMGLCFAYQGHEHEIAEVGCDGVKAVVSGGRAFTTVKFGSSVNQLGALVVLGHPACAEAAERLRKWRSDRARSSGRPAYIGPVKLEAYGPELTAMFEELRSPGLLIDKAGTGPGTRGSSDARTSHSLRGAMDNRRGGSTPGRARLRDGSR